MALNRRTARRALIAVTVASLSVGPSATPFAYGQGKVSGAPPGEPKAVASVAIKDADHACGKVVNAVRLDTGGIRATCSNGEAFRIFRVDGKVVAMKCSAAAKLGISGC